MLLLLFGLIRPHGSVGGDLLIVLAGDLLGDNPSTAFNQPICLVWCAVPSPELVKYCELRKAAHLCVFLFAFCSKFQTLLLQAKLSLYHYTRVLVFDALVHSAKALLS